MGKVPRGVRVGVGEKHMGLFLKAKERFLKVNSLLNNKKSKNIFCSSFCLYECSEVPITVFLIVFLFVLTISHNTVENKTFNQCYANLIFT